jgi:predicted secreted protein
MGKVKGEDVLLTMTNGSEFVPIGCARTLTYDIQQDLIETSITNNGKFRTYTSGAVTWSATVEGFTYLEKGNIDRMGIGELIDKLQYGEVFTLIWYEHDIDNLYFSRRTGQVLIESINETASFDNMSVFTLNLKGTGSINNEYGDV